MNRLDAVLFDMDGLLTDSESFNHQLVIDDARKLGSEVTVQLLDEITGMNEAECAAIISARCPGLDGARLMAMYRADRYEAAVRGQIPLKPGVCALLDVLERHGIPCAVASSNSRAVVEADLRGNGILHRFGAVVCGDMIRRSKPAPDIYLAAAEALGVRPEACLVLEDAPNGLRSGRSAGMRTCMVPDRIPYLPDYAPFTDHVCASLADVIPLIESWLS